MPNARGSRAKSRPAPRRRAAPKRPAEKRPPDERPPGEPIAPLETYRRKRDPDRTPEPFGGRVSAPTPAPIRAAASAPPRFVVQEHWARNLHFDLRLELEGVLKSWAVPKG
ncbi:MAG: DNA polymerase ligase N-terminal domain-containing protein, partial [Candidatus Eisenbacteria bacterium]